MDRQYCTKTRLKIYPNSQMSVNFNLAFDLLKAANSLGPLSGMTCCAMNRSCDGQMTYNHSSLHTLQHNAVLSYLRFINLNIKRRRKQERNIRVTCVASDRERTTQTEEIENDFSSSHNRLKGFAGQDTV